MILHSPEKLADLLFQPREEAIKWKMETAQFYGQYPTRRNGNEDTNRYSRFDMKPANTPKTHLYLHTKHLKNPILALIGVGSFRQQSLEYTYSQSIHPSKIIAIEPHATPEIIQLPFTHYRYDITDPLPNTLIDAAHIASMFDSVIMDIAPGLLIAAFIHLNQILKMGGIIAFDTNLDYRDEVRSYHKQHPNDPYGIFTRSWSGISPKKPIIGKFMRIDENLLHSIATHSGLSHIASYPLTTISFPGGKRRKHPRLTSIWQKSSDPNPKLLTLCK